MKTHCVHGHEYTKENTVPTSNGSYRCRQCNVTKYNPEYQKNWYQANRQRVINRVTKSYGTVEGKAKAMHRRLMREFGISLKEYEQKNSAQSGLCMICGKPCVSGRRLAVDHDHVNSQVRDLLCTMCNTGLGSFMESTDLLGKAIVYLKKWRK